MAGNYALIIGSSQYDDPNLGRLKAPDLDVRGLEEVLKSRAIGQFDEVVTLLSCSGTPDEVLGLVQARRNVGVDLPILGILGRNADTVMEELIAEA